MFHSLLGVSTISLTEEKHGASVCPVFLPGRDRGRPRVTILLPWTQTQKCTPVKRCCKRDSGEDYQEVRGRVKVLDA